MEGRGDVRESKVMVKLATSSLAWFVGKTTSAFVLCRQQPANAIAMNKGERQKYFYVAFHHLLSSWYHRGKKSNLHLNKI